MSKSFHKEFQLDTPKQNFINITQQVKEAVRESGVGGGICTVFCPHTTGGITVNENADPDVVIDLLLSLDTLCPDRPEYRHMEGNSAAHLKSSLMGCEHTFIVREGALLLGRWQGIYFCEFDGPRRRQFYVTVVGM